DANACSLRMRHVVVVAGLRLARHGQGVANDQGLAALQIVGAEARQTARAFSDPLRLDAALGALRVLAAALDAGADIARGRTPQRAGASLHVAKMFREGIDDLNAARLRKRDVSCRVVDDRD